MKYPQDYAERILKIKNLKSIKDNACCAFVFLWWLGIEPKDELEAIELVDEGIEKGNLDKECLVNWDSWGSALTGRHIDCEKIAIKNLKEVKGRAPVWFSIDGKTGHWVGVQNGKIVFNPIRNSKNVKEGKPMSTRKLTIRGIAK